MAFYRLLKRVSRLCKWFCPGPRRRRRSLRTPYTRRKRSTHSNRSAREGTSGQSLYTSRLSAMSNRTACSRSFWPLGGAASWMNSSARYSIACPRILKARAARREMCLRRARGEEAGTPQARAGTGRIFVGVVAIFLFLVSIFGTWLPIRLGCRYLMTNVTLSGHPICAE
jgi:hypothetical protein